MASEVSRRGFLGALAAALTLDPERALWVPGKKLISIAAPPFLAVGDIVSFGPYTERYVVTEEARSIARIGDARFRIDSPPSGYLLPHEGLYCSVWPPADLTPTILSFRSVIEAVGGNVREHIAGGVRRVV